MASGYREHAAHPDLQPYVACYWTRDAGGAPQRSHPVLPDGCIDLLFERRGEVLAVVGTMTRTLWVEHGGPTQFVGVRFRAGGAVPFLRERADLLTDGTVDAEAVLGRTAADLREHLLADAGNEARVRRLERFLLGALDRDVAAVDARVAWAAGRISRHPGCRVDALAADLGVSRQYLRRLFLQHAGVSPKVFARVARLQRVAETMRRGDVALLDAAIACGYADQAHLTREFKKMVGVTPAAYRARGSSFAPSQPDGVPNPRAG